MANVFLLDLPVELIHRIFDYCNICTILRSICCICCKMYDIVKSYNRFKFILDATLLDNIRAFISFIPSDRIISLRISDECWNDKSIFRFMSLFKNYQFTRLRSLILDGVQDNNLENLLQYFIIDSSVVLSTKSIEDENSTDFTLVSSISNQCKRRKLCVNNISNRVNVMWPYGCGLEYLKMTCCTFNDYLIILRQLCHLQTLVIDNYIVNTMSTALDLSVCHSSLRCLMITGNLLHKKEFELLLSLIPLLHHLKFVSSRETVDSMFDASYWEQLIYNKLPKLDKLEFFFSYHHGINNHFTSFESLVIPFRTESWIYSKYSFVTCAYVLRSSEICLYTIPINNMSNTQSFIYKESLMDNICRLIDQKLDKQFDNTLNEVYYKIYLK
ncbi:unnamed protein product [Rotaria sp. Silwood2]|nr:unnamed protein product [Rotaria sp. Silwood2]